MDKLANHSNISGDFTVQNISNKVIKIFGLKILPNQSYNLMDLEGITQRIIEISLSRGDLRKKIDDGLLVVTSSNLRYDFNYKHYLKINNALSNDPQKQAVWYIDSINGNDGNDGKTPQTALKTQLEWYARTAGLFYQNTTINILSDISESLNWVVEPANGGEVLTVLGQPTEILSATVSSATAWNPGTNSEGTITINSLPTSFTASGLVRKLGRITSGPRAGVSFWVIKDNGSKTARITPAMTELLDDPSSVHPQPGDNITFYELTNLSGSQFFNCHSRVSALTFQYFNIGNLGESNQHAIVMGDIFFNYCDVRGLDMLQAGQATTFCTLLDRFRLYDACYLYSNYSAWLNGVNIEKGSVESFYQIIQDGTMNIKFRGFVWMRNWTAIYNTTNGIIVSDGSQLKDSDRIFGNLGAGTGIVLGAAANYFYSTVPNLTATTANIIIGGTIRAWGTLPFTNTTNLAMAVVSIA